ncbi:MULTISPECIES: helix-turn-helix transcriptional regulator [unclassified Carboxylicivirga]|uniref:helix-turn-helix transcriptional regulator n=1 Tax=Carboxylicivirga TaxID=1628153 RepID=UPI003D337C42
MGNPELGVDLLVEHLSLSRATLYAKFKAILGIGVNAYINKRRMQVALERIDQTDDSVAEIATQLGFQSQGYFSTLFKQTYGQSPLKRRRQQKEGC